MGEVTESWECELGYPEEQLARILGNRLREFHGWMFGQTMAICDGRRYDPGTDAYEPSGCGPHGFIVYPWDLGRFLDGLPVID